MTILQQKKQREALRKFNINLKELNKIKTFRQRTELLKTHSQNTISRTTIKTSILRKKYKKLKFLKDCI